jgi:hypothetical protein
MSLTTIIIAPLAAALFLILIGLILDTLDTRMRGVGCRPTHTSRSLHVTVFKIQEIPEIVVRVRRR